jgi:hypothetical protein
MAFYTRSNGDQVVIEEMPFPHLKSATLKMARMDPSNPELPAMQREVAKREAIYEEEQRLANGGS